MHGGSLEQLKIKTCASTNNTTTYPVLNLNLSPTNYAHIESTTYILSNLGKPAPDGHCCTNIVSMHPNGRRSQSSDHLNIRGYTEPIVRWLFATTSSASVHLRQLINES